MSKKGVQDANQTILKNMENSEENKDIFVRIAQVPSKILEGII